MASIAKRPDATYRARYRDSSGKEHSRHFTRKVDAQRWLDEITASIVTGSYVHPKAGDVTFRDYAESWRSKQVHRPGTADQVERTLRRWVYPRLGSMPLSAIRQSDVQGLVSALSKGERPLAPATVSVAYRHVSTIFRAAVADKRIHESPCAKVRLPRIEQSKVVPLATEVVTAIAQAVPARYRAMVVLAASTGMRQGEVFGLTVDRIDFLRRTVRVDRQLVGISGHAPVFAPPKTDASYRTIPLPQVAVDALATHLAAFPVGDKGLVFTGSEGQMLRRSAFGNVWRRATASAGAEGVVFHALRHYYASLLIRHGESVKTVQARLGHKSATETLDTYSHLWPDSDDRARDAVDEVLGTPADQMRTAVGSPG
ncbi:tyrosine-type recombinase/integrase [Dermatophilaceae bacterium Soc4.6]